jgi:hypothetical protein
MAWGFLDTFRIHQEWDPPLPFGRVPRKVFNMGLPRRAVWLKRVTLAYLALLVVFGLVYVAQDGHKLRCVNRYGTYVLAGGGFTQRVTPAECEAHEAALLRVFSGFAFVFTLGIALNSTVRRANHPKRGA